MSQPTASQQTAATTSTTTTEKEPVWKVSDDNPSFEHANIFTILSRDDVPEELKKTFQGKMVELTNGSIKPKEGKQNAVASFEYGEHQYGLNYNPKTQGFNAWRRKKSTSSGGGGSGKEVKYYRLDDIQELNAAEAQKFLKDHNKEFWNVEQIIFHPEKKEFVWFLVKKARWYPDNPPASTSTNEQTKQ